jgi:tetratricopeptide (TPR) repeat protein
MRRLVIVLGLVVALLAVGGILLRPRGGPDRTAAAPAEAGAADAASTVDVVARSIDAARKRLERVPGDWTTWAQLGVAYVEQARVTGDPSNYARAEEALNRSLQVRATDNALALTGLGALAAARHDFAAALDYGNRSLAIDPYKAVTHGVVADALVELGRYPESLEAIQKMVDLRPDTSSYARASYSFELRGDVANARDVMQRALTAATGPADAAFALEHLSGLAFDNGDLATAKSNVDDGLRRFRDHPPLLVLRGRIAAASGDTAAAIADYRTALAKLPQPGWAGELGDLLAATGDAAGAEQQYALVRASAALLREQGVDVDTEQAVFAADHGDPAAALTAAQAAYARRPSIWVADALAWALHVAGRDAEALPYAEQALKLGTRNAGLLYHRGAIRAALGDKAGAAADLSAALAVNPHFSVRHAPQAQRLLATVR